MSVHNHPPYRPNCNERRLPDGQLRGACINDDATDCVEPMPCHIHGGEWRSPVERLRRAATLMREQHGPDHERHEMWSAMATLLFMAADHADGRGNTCESCVGQALAVADAYPDVVTSPGERT